jgi:hypothetical protein
MPAPVDPNGLFGLNLLTTATGLPVRMITACLVSGTMITVDSSATTSKPSAISEGL